MIVRTRLYVRISVLLYITRYMYRDKVIVRTRLYVKKSVFIYN